MHSYPLHLRARRVVGLVLLAAVTISVAAACTPSTPSAPADQTAQGGDGSLGVTVAQDIKSWALPLDPYLLSDAELVKSSYASAILIHQCLSEHGINRPVPYVDVDATYGANQVVRRWFDHSVASNYGYHDPAQVRPDGLKAWDDFQKLPWSPSEDEVFLACRDDPSSDVAEYSDTVLGFTPRLASAAYSGSAVDPDVAKTAASWRVCMADAGIEDLPTSPVEMPTESMRQRFGITGGMDSPVSSPSVEEIELAVKDAGCRDSSGFTQTFYHALWTRETTMLADNAAALRDVESEISDTAKTIEQIIAESRAG